MKNRKVTELLVERGLVDSEARAGQLIESDRVLADGFPVSSRGSLFAPDVDLEVVSSPEKWVGRGARKILPFLEKKWLDVEGKICLDVGASTGGFTQALLEFGAKLVHAVDVGYGQLAYRLQNDDRVNRLDRYNFRHADPDDFQPPPEIFTMDVSFISTVKLIPALQQVLVSGATGLVLIKPQFEAEKEEAAGGVIESRSLRREVVDRVVNSWEEKGWNVEEVAPTPLKGSSGNQEFIARISQEVEAN